MDRSAWRLEPVVLFCHFAPLSPFHNLNVALDDVHYQPVLPLAVFQPWACRVPLPPCAQLLLLPQEVLLPLVALSAGMLRENKHFVLSAQRFALFMHSYCWLRPMCAVHACLLSLALAHIRQYLSDLHTVASPRCDSLLLLMFNLQSLHIDICRQHLKGNQAAIRRFAYVHVCCLSVESCCRQRQEKGLDQMVVMANKAPRWNEQVIPACMLQAPYGLPCFVNSAA